MAEDKKRAQNHPGDIEIADEPGGPRPASGGRLEPGCPPEPGRGQGVSAENELTDIPPFISACFDNELSFDGNRRLYLTLGQFSLIRLERDSQLLIPMYDYCMPTRECSGEDPEDDPCEAFRQIRFPVGEFFPPNTLPGMEEEPRSGCGCCD